MTTSLLAYCRPGFEGDLANELQDKAASVEVYGFARTQSGSGFVLFECYQNGDAQKLAKRLSVHQLVFARQMFVCVARLQSLDAADRISRFCKPVLMCRNVVNSGWNTLIPPRAGSCHGSVVSLPYLCVRLYVKTVF